MTGINFISPADCLGRLFCNRIRWNIMFMLFYNCKYRKSTLSITMCLNWFDEVLKKHANNNNNRSSRSNSYRNHRAKRIRLLFRWTITAHNIVNAQRSDIKCRIQIDQEICNCKMCSNDDDDDGDDGDDAANNNNNNNTRFIVRPLNVISVKSSACGLGYLANAIENIK